MDAIIILSVYMHIQKNNISVTQRGKTLALAVGPALVLQHVPAIMWPRVELQGLQCRHYALHVAVIGNETRPTLALTFANKGNLCC